MDAGGGNDVIIVGDGVNYVQGGAGDDFIQPVTAASRNSKEVKETTPSFPVAAMTSSNTVSDDGIDTINTGAGNDTLSVNGSALGTPWSLSANGSHAILFQDANNHADLVGDGHDRVSHVR